MIICNNPSLRKIRQAASQMRPSILRKYKIHKVVITKTKKCKRISSMIVSMDFSSHLNQLHQQFTTSHKLQLLKKVLSHRLWCRMLIFLRNEILWKIGLNKKQQNYHLTDSLMRISEIMIKITQVIYLAPKKTMLNLALFRVQ